MKTSLFTLLIAFNTLLFIFIGCDPLENGPKRSDTVNGIAGSVTETEGNRHLYVSGISYPEGYDWRRDTAYGHVSCNIFLMRDGEMVCSIPAGGNEGVAAAPDRHHIIDGHLYTEHIDRAQTVIQRDGKEILRYKGTESMRGLLLAKGKLLTLGQDISGSGFSLRRNGKVLYGSADGVILGSFSDKAYSRSGALYDDEGLACFSYFREENGKRTWHFVDDGEESPLTGDGISNIFDMRTMKGRHFAVARLSGGEAPVLLSDGGRADFSKSLRYPPSNDYRLSLCDDKVLIAGNYRTTNISNSTGFWDENGFMTVIASDCRRYRYREGMFEYLQTSSGKVISTSFGGTTTHVTGEWRIMTPQCLCWAEDGPVVALTPLSAKENPAIWRGGTYTGIKINGFLTGVAMGD